MNNLCKNRVSCETISNAWRLGRYRQLMFPARLSQPQTIHLYDEGTFKGDGGLAVQLPTQWDGDTASVPNFFEKLAS